MSQQAFDAMLGAARSKAAAEALARQPYIAQQYTRGQVGAGYAGPTRRYFDEQQLLTAAQQGAQAGSRIWSNPGSALTSRVYPIVGTSPDTVYGGPREASRDPNALARLNWQELSMWGPLVVRADNAREAVALTELSVAADDNIGGDNAYGFSGNPGTFGIAYFPVVYRFTAAGSITQGSGSNLRDVKVVPFAVVASSTPWQGSYFGLSGPQYVQLQQPNSQVQLMLDVNFCKNDTNLVLSAMASVLSFLPGRWASAAQGGAVQCFLTIAPAISLADAQEFHGSACQFMGEDPSNVNIRQSMAFGGASLGLAVAAAVCGLPPMLYTGYLSSMGMDHVFYGQQTSRDALRAGIPIEALSRVILGATFVESVDDVPFKVNYAINVGMPIVIPLNPTWTNARAVEGLGPYRAAMRAARSNGYTTQRQESIVKRALIAAGLPMEELERATKINFAETMSDYIMTVQKLAGGKSFMEVGSLVMAASNYADTRMLACKYAGYVYGGYVSDPNYNRDAAKQRAGTIAQRLEAKGLLKTAVQRDVNQNKTVQRRAAKAEGNPIPKPKAKKTAENPWMTVRKAQQKEKANAATRAQKQVLQDPAVKAAIAAARRGGGGGTAGGKFKPAAKGKAAPKVSAKAAGKVKAAAAGLMRASKASRMQFLQPMADPQGYQFVAATTEMPTLQQLRMKRMSDAYRDANPYVPGTSYGPGDWSVRANVTAPVAVGGSMFSDMAAPALSSQFDEDAPTRTRLLGRGDIAQRRPGSDLYAINAQRAPRAPAASISPVDQTMAELFGSP